MNSYERVMRKMEGKEVDRLPNMSLVMMFAAKQIGVPYGQYVTDYRLLTKGALYCYEKFGLDMVCVISDPMREAEGFGAKVIIPEDGVPYSRENRLNSIKEIETLKIVDPSTVERMHDRLQAVRYLKERVGNEVPVIGWIEGAVAESCDLMNISEAFINFLDEPEEMQHLLEICSEQAILFAKAQIEAGADIIGMGDAAASLLGPELYEEFALPYQQKIIKEIHNMGAKVRVHICGNINSVLDLVGQSGANIIDLDHMVDMTKAAELFKKETVICGNFDPVTVLLQGNEEVIRKEVLRCMEIQKAHLNMVCSGCEVPKDTPIENMVTVMKTLQGK